MQTVKLAPITFVNRDPAWLGIRNLY